MPAHTTLTYANMKEAGCALVKRISRWIGEKNYLLIPASGTGYNKQTASSEWLEPGVCLLIQELAQDRGEDDECSAQLQSYLFMAADFASVLNVIRVNPEKPLLGLIMTLDLRTLAQLIAENCMPVLAQPQDRGCLINGINTSMLDAFIRLLDALNTPEDISILAPLITKEIFYRLLQGKLGPSLYQSVLQHGGLNESYDFGLPSGIALRTRDNIDLELFQSPHSLLPAPLLLFQCMPPAFTDDLLRIRQ